MTEISTGRCGCEGFRLAHRYIAIQKDKLAQIHLIQAQEFYYGYDNESVICKKN